MALNQNNLQKLGIALADDNLANYFAKNQQMSTSTPADLAATTVGATTTTLRVAVNLIKTQLATHNDLFEELKGNQ